MILALGLKKMGKNLPFLLESVFWYLAPPSDRAERRYKVERILAYRQQPRGDTKNVDDHQFLISWEGYDSDENTWEPYKSLKEDIPDLLSAFMKANKIYL